MWQDTFQATIGEIFAPVISLRDDDIDIDSMFTTCNTTVTDTAAGEIHGKECCRRKPWVF